MELELGGMAEEPEPVPNAVLHWLKELSAFVTWSNMRRSDTYLNIGVGFHSTWLVLIAGGCIGIACCWLFDIIAIEVDGREASLGISKPADTGGVIG